MTTALSSEIGISPLPVTGAGPFSIVVGLIGVVAVASGVLLKHVAQRKAVVLPDGSPTAGAPGSESVISA
jgi:hypothetical protein